LIFNRNLYILVLYKDNLISNQLRNGPKMLPNKLFLVNNWLHLSSACLLIGGMVFLVAVLRPVLGRNYSISGINTLADQIHKRFRAYVGIIIGVIIVTGILNSVTGMGKDLNPEYIIIIRIKVILAICLFIIYGVNAFLIKEHKGDGEENCSCVIKPPVYKRILQIIALLLVFVILFLAITLRFL